MNNKKRLITFVAIIYVIVLSSISVYALYVTMVVDHYQGDIYATPKLEQAADGEIDSAVNLADYPKYTINVIKGVGNYNDVKIFALTDESIQVLARDIQDPSKTYDITNYRMGGKGGLDLTADISFDIYVVASQPGTYKVTIEITSAFDEEDVIGAKSILVQVLAGQGAPTQPTPPEDDQTIPDEIKKPPANDDMGQTDQGDVIDKNPPQTGSFWNVPRLVSVLLISISALYLVLDRRGRAKLK